MENFKEKKYEVFKMFEDNWALVTAGTIDNFNSCTLGWGSLGNIWGDGRKSFQTVTIYVHPDRYTSKFLKENDTFTVSFFPEKYKKALAYMGSHSGRDTNKVVASGLSPIEIGKSVTFSEANLTFLCKKIYQHQFSKEGMADEIKDYYSSMPKVFPDYKGGWQGHIVFIGRIIEAQDER